MTHDAPAPLSAAIYSRISRDDRGDEAGVRRQEADCRELAAQLGYTVAAVFTDNDRGASTRSKKARPAYAEMLHRARAGEFSAVLAYSTSRLTRRPKENEDLIELVERRGVQIKTVVSGDYRLDTADGRAVARTLAAWDAAEAERTAERVKRAMLERAKEGRSHGITPWGWTRAFDGTEQLDTEVAPILKDVARRVLAGASLRSVCADLNARGVATPSGKGSWNATVLRQVLLRERNAGRRVLYPTPKEGERRRAHAPMITRGKWPAILSEDEQDQLIALLTDPARRTSRGTEVRYLMSGKLLCGKCGARMRSQVGAKFTRKDGTGGRRPWAYVCAVNFCTRAKAEDVDEAVEGLLLARLRAEDGPTVLSADRGGTQAAADRLAGLQARLDRAADEYADGLIEASQLSRITERLRPQIAAAELELSASMPSPVLAAFSAEARQQSVDAAWAGASLDVRRAVLDALATFTLKPAGSGSQWSPDRLAVRWVGNDSVTETEAP
ncbi:hypothetical protein BH708_06340 [Brachybacterium sp. P6-10-X1]|uniref:recombinase family protein n=1 Tax=Brachybacterium sp. P6-10-X1 TaxID=1903186 RepID=UPI000971A152|nr:recombinase family protein [Brachybacterium sp. P6-10-X1]APX32402.1 hypothetical protein BH708_06340 [Brachybacterium sp. P6-10-X1]